jgi:REP element-mobilizing transposase RayT
MPRSPRLDYPGALHHLIVRGIDRGAIFRTDQDRRLFLDRLAALVIDSHAGLYAWALMPNHAHVLLRTGTLPLSRFALRWLGPYASAFNRLHHRVGYLFQNRFTNGLVEEEPYFLELVRYIHLNPVRSRLPVSIESLDQYPWTGHSVILGHQPFPAQDPKSVLHRFVPTIGAARTAYRAFVREGMRSARRETPHPPAPADRFPAFRMRFRRRVDRFPVATRDSAAGMANFSLRHAIPSRKREISRFRTPVRRGMNGLPTPAPHSAASMACFRIPGTP